MTGQGGALLRVAFMVNGERRVVRAQPDTPLLYVLRNELGLMGARFGCGLGICGACFVHLDGVVVPSCETPVWSVEGRAVVTVEGLAAEGELHPVQQAVLDEQAAQCAYCVTGVIMSGAALLRRQPRPDEATVVEALERNLCRCGAHGRMVRAVVRAGQAAAAAATRGASGGGASGGGASGGGASGGGASGGGAGVGDADEMGGQGG
jgi:nicotinate dehydrogenase subunit A